MDNVLHTSDLILSDGVFKRMGNKLSSKIINSFISICVDNIVNNFGSMWPDGAMFKAVLAPITRRSRNYSSKQALYTENIRVDTINPYYPDHYLSIRASGAPIDIVGMKFKAAPSLRKRCSKKCYNGQYYQKVEI